MQPLDYEDYYLEPHFIDCWKKLWCQYGSLKYSFFNDLEKDSCLYISM